MEATSKQSGGGGKVLALLGLTSIHKAYLEGEKAILLPFKGPQIVRQ